MICKEALIMEEIIKEYKEKARKARVNVLEMIYKAQSSHIGSNFSAIDILTVVFDIADIDEKLKEERDRIVVSKGWIAASMYYFLSEKGVIEKDDLKDFCKEGSKYIGLAEPNVRGIEAAGGSMGFGLPFGVGFAIAKKIKKEKGRVFVLMSDGEMDIGTTWESALIGSHHKLDNLTVIVDLNNFQAMGKTDDILKTKPLKEKWQSFGWDAKEIDGHNFSEIKEALIEEKNGKPKIVIARTTKGKGVSFMENENIYHYKPPSDDEYQKALKEIWEK